MAGSEVQLVCFDWGGVLLRHCRSWAEGCASAGLEVRGDSDSPARAALRRPLAQEYQVGAIGTREFFDRLHASLDALYTRDELERLHDAWLLGEYAGVHGLVRELAGVRGLETALLSNTNEGHWRRHIATTHRPADYPTPGLLKHRHASHLLGLAKPGVEIFRAFEDATGYRGGRVLFFDDLEENVAAARSIGWRAVVIDHTQETVPQIRAGLAAHGIPVAGSGAVDRDVELERAGPRA